MLLLVGVGLSVYFSYNAVYGARSYTSLQAKQEQLNLKIDELETVRAERKVLESKVVMMRPETLSTDMLEERARAVLGYQREGEVVVLGN